MSGSVHSKISRETEVIAANTPFETLLHIIKGPKPGPTAAVIAGNHGNEPAGYRAAQIIKCFNISRGTLLVIPKANRPAIKARQREDQEIGDLNRSFPREPSEKPKNVLSEAIWDVYKRYEVKWSIDLHEGWGIHRRNPLSVGQSLIYYPRIRSRKMGRKVVKQLNQTVNQPGRKFSLIDNTREGTITRSTGNFLGVYSYTFETYRKQAIKIRISQHVTAVYTLLKYLGMNPKRPPRKRFFKG